MAKILVLYYSSYGHTAKMAVAAAEGAASAGATADVRRVPETAPKEVAEASHFQIDTSHREAQPDDLVAYDGIIIASPTRYGNMSSQMAAFWDRTGSLWAKGALTGKVGGAMSSTASQHGGNEATLFSIHKTLLHMGMIIVGLPYSFQGQLATDQIVGGSPYGATTIANGDGSRQPSQIELDGARFQGRLVAETAAKLFG